MVSISVVIIAFNEEKHIGRCITSVSKVADEVVVVDSFSTDRTREISDAMGARVVQHPFAGFTTQKNFAMEQAAHDYVLSLDADEYLSPELEASILAIRNNWSADAFDFNRLNSYAGKWIKTCGWYPDRKIRLWDRRKGRWKGDLVHEVVSMEAGTHTVTLKGDLLHEAYQNAAQLIKKMQGSYADLYAEQHAFRKRVSTFKIFYKTIASFFKSYVVNLGFTDGYEGLVISASNANGTFYKYAKLLERNRRPRVSLVIALAADTTADRIVADLGMLAPRPAEVVLIDAHHPDRVAIALRQASLPFPVLQVGIGQPLAVQAGIDAASQEYVVLGDNVSTVAAGIVQQHCQGAWRGRALRDAQYISFFKSDLPRNAAATKAVIADALGKRGVRLVGL